MLMPRKKQACTFQHTHGLHSFEINHANLKLGMEMGNMYFDIICNIYLFTCSETNFHISIDSGIQLVKHSRLCIFLMSFDYLR